MRKSGHTMTVGHDKSDGPLAGIRVLELAGIGPGPFAAMLLADMGADVIRIDRVDGPPRIPDASVDLMGRGRRSVAIDLKHPQGRAAFLRLAEHVDALLEVFRPGVMERLGIGPAECMARNPRLIYARLTGWGQTGPLASAAGHDLNYIALSGALDAIGPAGGPPVPPLTIVGDFAGGGLLAAFGVVCALLEARASGLGQVIDAAMVDGAALLTTHYHALLNAGQWSEARGTNRLDGGAPFYGLYETADARFVAVAPLEDKFYAELLERLGLRDLPDRAERASWPRIRERLAATFRTRTLAEWRARLEGTDACVAGVVTFAEARTHPHLRARETFVDVNGAMQPAPAPRLSRTPGRIRRPPAAPGEHSDEVLRDLGWSPEEIGALRRDRAIR